MIDIFRKSTKSNGSVKKETKVLTLKIQLYLLIKTKRSSCFRKWNIFTRKTRKGKQEKGLTTVSDCLTRVVSVAKFSDSNISDRKLSDRKQLKIITPKQI